jgi:hypothetical protein
MNATANGASARWSDSVLATKNTAGQASSGTRATKLWRVRLPGRKLYSSPLFDSADSWLTGLRSARLVRVDFQAAYHELVMLVGRS